jgi:twitching motility two-component system response regulator PilG
MQGTLNEIDIRSILQLIELGQRTGELFIESYTPSSALSRNDELGSATLKSRATLPLAEKFWFIFFVNGQIVYAADNSSQNFSRLLDYLRPYQPDISLEQFLAEPIVSSSTPEYSYIWRLLEKNLLTPAQGRKILQGMIQESLFDLFNLRQGEFIFETAPPLAPQLQKLAIASLITKTGQQVQQWKQFYPHIESPDQYFTPINTSQLRATLPEKPYLSLERWAKRRATLRQLARYLQREMITLGRGLYPYAERGWLQFNYPHPQPEILGSSTSQKLPHVLCIDDDLSLSKTVEALLEVEKYPVSVFTNPLEALSQVFLLQPDVILCDIAMPILDGYEICAMLRHSTLFRQTPIIMLTGKEGFIDRVRARMVGATEYLTKPFGSEELLFLLEKYS